MNQKVKREKHCPKCGSKNLTYQYIESALGLKGNRFICEECGFRWSED